MGGNQIENIDVVKTAVLQSRFDEADIFLNDKLDAQNTQTIINLPTPTNGGDATNKTYVDAGDASLAADLSDLQTYVDTTVDSAISTLASDLADETAARIADVNNDGFSLSTRRNKINKS